MLGVWYWEWEKKNDKVIWGPSAGKYIDGDVNRNIMQNWVNKEIEAGFEHVRLRCFGTTQVYIDNRCRVISSLKKNDQG